MNWNCSRFLLLPLILLIGIGKGAGAGIRSGSSASSSKFLLPGVIEQLLVLPITMRIFSLLAIFIALLLTLSASHAQQPEAGFLSALTSFRDQALDDYEQALRSAASEKVVNISALIERGAFGKLPKRVAWSYLFSTSIPTHGYAANHTHFVAYYNPWLDLFVLQLWQERIAGYRLEDTELVLGDAVRGEPVQARPLWLRKGGYLPEMLAHAVQESLASFISRAKEHTPESFRHWLSTGTGDLVAGYALAEARMYENWGRLRLLRTPSSGEDAALQELREKILSFTERLVASGTEEALKAFPLTSAKTHDAFTGMNAEQLSDLTPIFWAANATEQIAFLVSHHSSDFSVAISRRNEAAASPPQTRAELLYLADASELARKNVISRTPSLNFFYQSLAAAEVTHEDIATIQRNLTSRLQRAYAFSAKHAFSPIAATPEFDGSSSLLGALSQGNLHSVAVDSIDKATESLKKQSRPSVANNGSTHPLVEGLTSRVTTSPQEGIVREQRPIPRPEIALLQTSPDSLPSVAATTVTGAPSPAVVPPDRIIEVETWSPEMPSFKTYETYRIYESNVEGTSTAAAPSTRPGCTPMQFNGVIGGGIKDNLLSLTSQIISPPITCTNGGCVKMTKTSTNLSGIQITLKPDGTLSGTISSESSESTESSSGCGAADNTQTHRTNNHQRTELTGTWRQISK